MSEHVARVVWERGEQTFLENRYSRAHAWEFDGGVSVPASPSPHVVPPPMSVEAAVDPEEAFVASLSSCHMLFFLAFAAKRGFVVDRYADDAVGILEKDAEGKMAMTKVALRPKIAFSGDARPSPEDLEKLHHQAHEACFIASSVKTAVSTEIE